MAGRIRSTALTGAVFLAALATGDVARAAGDGAQVGNKRSAASANQAAGADAAAAHEALLRGRYQEAAELYRSAGERTPPALLWFLLAERQAKAGNLVHGRELLELVLKELSDEKSSAALQQLRREAAERAEVLDLRTPKVTISVRRGSGRDLRVSLDGRRVWTGQIQHVNPGEHEVLAETDHASMKRSFLAVEGREALVELVMPQGHRARSPAAPGHPMSPPSPSTPSAEQPAPPATGISWTGPGVVWGLGAFAGIVSVTASVVASEKADDILAQCVDNVCPASPIPEVQEVNDLDDVSIATGIVAGAAGVLGALMVLAQVPGDDAAFAVGPGSLHYRMRF